MLGDHKPFGEKQGQGVYEEDEIYDDGFLRVEHKRYYATCAGHPLYHLTRKEFLILSRLVLEAGRPVKKQEIWCSVWGRDAEFNYNTFRVHIASLRRKLAPYGLDIVAVVHVGYRLMISRER